MLIHFRQNFVISEKKDAYKLTLTLTIKKFSEDDVGTYTCISTNSLGRKQGTSRLYSKFTNKPSMCIRQKNYNFMYFLEIKRQSEYVAYGQENDKTTGISDVVNIL